MPAMARGATRTRGLTRSACFQLWLAAPAIANMRMPMSSVPRLRHLAHSAGFAAEAPLPSGPACRAHHPLRGSTRLPGILRIFALFATFGASHFTAHAGDLLRGGAPAGQRGVPSGAAQSAGAAEAARAAHA